MAQKLGATKGGRLVRDFDFFIGWPGFLGHIGNNVERLLLFGPGIWPGRPVWLLEPVCGRLHPPETIKNQVEQTQILVPIEQKAAGGVIHLIATANIDQLQGPDKLYRLLQRDGNTNLT